MRPLDEVIEELEVRYTDNPLSAQELAVLHPYYQEALKDPEKRQAFETKLLQRVGGLYIPYIFWLYLREFLESPEVARPKVFSALQAFVESAFDPLTQKQMKPLLAMYFKYEGTFHVDRISIEVLRHAHPDIRAYFEKMQTFPARNPETTHIYEEKFNLLKNFFPNFEWLFQPLPYLRQAFA
ncbi:MAG: hypothetical protein ACUVRD_08650 [Bacteroidia bacterium]